MKLGRRLSEILKELTAKIFMLSIFMSDTSCRTKIPMRAAQIDNCCRSQVKLQYWESENDYSLIRKQFNKYNKISYGLYR